MKFSVMRYAMLPAALAGSFALYSLTAASGRVAPDPGNAGLKLPAGFGALVVVGALAGAALPLESVKLEAPIPLPRRLHLENAH